MLLDILRVYLFIGMIHTITSFALSMIVYKDQFYALLEQYGGPTWVSRFLLLTCSMLIMVLIWPYALIKTLTNISN